MSSLRVTVAGTGSAVPARVVTNLDLQRTLDTDDEWIVSRTGIRERRFLERGKGTSSLAIEAARRALASAEVAPKDLDLIVCATMTPDYVIPCTAGLVQRGLGAENAGGFDLQAACSGFVFGLTTAAQFVATGQANNVLVCGADVMSSVVDPADRGTAVIFADAAGAAVVRPSRDGEPGALLWSRMRVQGDDDVLLIPAGGSRLATSSETVEKRQHFVQMKGRETFRFAVSKFVDLIEEALQKTSLRASDIALVVPHQVNLRIIESAVRRLDVPLERVAINIDRYGNASAGSVPLALDEAVRAGRVKRGDNVLLVAFGAGLTWGSALLRW